MTSTPATTILSKTDKVTIYFRGDFGGAYNRIECRFAEAVRRRYAQYDSAAQVVFTPKGARKARYLMQTSHPSVVILAGHGHFEPEGTFGKPVRSNAGCMVSTSRHTMFSGGFDTDFSNELDSYLADNPSVSVLLDLRGMNAHDRFAATTETTEKAEGSLDRA